MQKQSIQTKAKLLLMLKWCLSLQAAKQAAEAAAAAADEAGQDPAAEA